MRIKKICYKDLKIVLLKVLLKYVIKYILNLNKYKKKYKRLNKFMVFCLVNQEHS